MAGLVSVALSVEVWAQTSGRVRALEVMVLGLWLGSLWPIASAYSLAKAHSLREH